MKEMCELKRIVGFQKKVKGGLVFSRHATLFYICGQTGVFYSVEDDEQKFFPIAEKSELTAMALGANNFLALASKENIPKLTVYNLKSKDKFVLPNPDKMTGITEYVYVSFSEDYTYLAAQGGEFSWSFIMWHLERRCLLTVFLPFRLEIGAKVLKLSFNPKNSNEVVAIGRYFFRRYHYKSEQRLKEEAFHELERSKITFFSLTWFENSKKFAVGTSDGMILIFVDYNLKQKVIIDEKLKNIPRILNKIGNPVDKCITSLLSYKMGLICSYGSDSVLCLHWKIDGKDFNIVASVHIPKIIECSEESKIVQLVLNSNEDILAASTDTGQILTFHFNVPGMLDSLGYEAEFDIILDHQHKMPVICADTAINKTTHVTCSKSTLLLWNYKERKLLLLKNFEDEICSVSIHPLGFIILIGFKGFCKVYNILQNKLEEVRMFDTEGCSKVRFSSGGHMLAFSSKNRLEFYSNLNFEKIAEFKGNEEIKDLRWKDNDNRLLSLNENGILCEWEVALREKLRSYPQDTGAYSAFDIFGDSAFAAGSDGKIHVIEEQERSYDIETKVKITSVLVTKFLLMVGTENGTVLGYNLPYDGNKILEKSCHQGCIINMTVKENGQMLLVTGEDGAISIWKLKDVENDFTPIFDEVLIEEDLYKSKLETISQLERELKLKTDAAHSKIAKQLQLQDTQKTELKTYYEDILNQLRETLTMLTEEKYNIMIKIEQLNLEHFETLCKEREENHQDFQTKLEKEIENLEKLSKDRVRKIEEYESEFSNLKQEIIASNEKVKKVREEKENRLQDLETELQKEQEERQKQAEENRQFYKDLEGKAKDRSEETNCNFARDIEKARKENQLMSSEVEKLTAMLEYEKECGRTLDAVFGKKEQMCDDLKKITEKVKNRISEISNEIQRKDVVLKDKTSMIDDLEEDAEEIKHLIAETNWKHEECKTRLQEKSEELSKLFAELESVESERKYLIKKLKNQKREQELLDEKLRSTEKSVAGSSKELLTAQLLLERYRKEFTDSTKDIDNVTALKFAILKLYDKRVLRKRIKEEDVFVGDMDPYMKFCRQRKHYELLINTVLNRKQEIQASFRLTYVNLAKENSDWTAFAEDLRSDVKQKQERIHILETLIKMPAKDFIQNLSETQKRFYSAYESIKLVEKEEDEEIQKRINLIGIQTMEIQRLHGILVVDERGKIVKKINH